MSPPSSVSTVTHPGGNTFPVGLGMGATQLMLPPNELVLWTMLVLAVALLVIGTMRKRNGMPAQV
jgi:hypothetical protein